VCFTFHHIKLFESFDEVGVNKILSIAIDDLDHICRKYGVKDYTINPDESIIRGTDIIEQRFEEVYYRMKLEVPENLEVEGYNLI